MANLLNKVRLGHPLRPYYHGQHKWENYLVDIQEAVTQESTSNRTIIRDGFAAAGASITLLDSIQEGIENLAEEFAWGFTLLIDTQTRQIEQLNKIVDQLVAVRKAIQSPLLTEAKELFVLGQEHLRDGLLNEALERFLAAETLNKVNFPLQLQLGKLYLYGKNKTDDVINLGKSEEHLLLAARYAGADEQWRRYRGEAFFHAAVANYVTSEKMENDGKNAIAASCLEQALVHLRYSSEAWPEFSEICYLEAKCYALLKKNQSALERLKVLSQKNPFGYFNKADQDEDFNSIRKEVTTLFNSEIEPIDQIIKRGRETQSRAREIMGKNFLGTEEVAIFFGVTYHYQQLQQLSTIPFSEEFLWEHRNTHILVAGFPITLSEIVERAKSRIEVIPGSDIKDASPRISCEWYLFCKTPIGWEPYPLKMEFDDQKKLLGARDLIPNCDELTYVTTLYFMATGEKLFEGGKVQSCDTCYTGSWKVGHLCLAWEFSMGDPKLYARHELSYSPLNSTAGLASMQKGNLSTEEFLTLKKITANRVSQRSEDLFSRCCCFFCEKLSDVEKCAICGKFFCKSHGEHLTVHTPGNDHDCHWVRCKDHPRKRRGLSSLFVIKEAEKHWEDPDFYC